MENAYLLLCITGSFLLLGMLFLASAIRIVQEDMRLSVYRLGRYIGEKGPGLVVLLPFIDRGVRKEVSASNKAADHGLAGAVGKTRTTVYTEGKVFVAGEEWDAMSQSPISAGQRVRVVRMVLEVEKEPSGA
jgi:regulator of protease activity HflC (stomatin/prohibitin superfamily)